MLKLDKELDRESEPLYRVDIVLYKETVSPDVLETKRLNVIITDVNDNEPKFDTDVYKFDLVENTPIVMDNRTIMTSSGFLLGRVKAFDKDLEENGTIEYFFSPNSLISYNSTGGSESGKKILSTCFDLLLATLYNF